MSNKKAPEAPVVEEKIVTEVKANDRGYAFLGKITGAPESFENIKTATFAESETETVIGINRSKEDAGNMLRRGYLHIGKNAKAEVSFANGKITVKLAKPRKMPVEKVEAEPAVA